MSAYGFLNNFICVVNTCSPRLNRSEYVLALLNCFDGKLRERIMSLIGPEGMNQITPFELHKIILTSTGELLNLPSRRAKFYNFVPRQTSCTLVEILSDLTTLGQIANVGKNDIFLKVLKIIPTDAASILQTKYSLLRLVNPNAEPPNSNVILQMLSEQLEEINKALFRMYGKKGDREKVYAVREESVKRENFEKKCLFCLKGGHVEADCWKRQKTKCILCGGQHPTPKCRVYRDVQPLVQPCKRCNINLFHPESQCKTKN